MTYAPTDAEIQAAALEIERLLDEMSSGDYTFHWAGYEQLARGALEAAARARASST